MRIANLYKFHHQHKKYFLFYKEPLNRMKAIFVISALLGVSIVLGDTPATCLYEDIIGTWTFTETERLEDHTVTCDVMGKIEHIKTFIFSFPNIVTDELGNKGTWTLIYNQGYEVNINERSYFAFSYYNESDGETTSYCDRTFNGWSRDRTVRNWSCFKAVKDTPVPPRVSSAEVSMGQRNFINNHRFINTVNKIQSSWTAKAYPENEKYSLQEMFLRAGGPKSKVYSRVHPAPATEEQKARAALLPDNFDWRNVEGVNYVSPVRDQKSCGSCYAFASMASLEARLRVATKNERQDVFSVQDVLDCSLLAQGCLGGFNYLIAGRYAQDQGVIAESCNPYVGVDGTCETGVTCDRTYVSEYEYLGGYYGACNEELMMEALITGGPYPVSYEVYNDFYYYTDGVYEHTELRDEFNPFEITNHAVLLVGYGVNETTGQKYWTCKNSWGEDFGEQGFFNIIRGVDNCAIESMAFIPTVIP